MKWVIALFVLSLIVPVMGQEWNFEDAQLGKLPKHWVATRADEGPGSDWLIVDDKTAPNGSRALAQVSADSPRALFNLCVAEETSYQNVDMTVAFKAVRGKVDQGGGPVWRYRDESNYYVARMNPLEDNFRVYKVVDGKRTELKSADVKIPKGEWHRIRVVHVGDHIQCYLDGKLSLDVTDKTFSAAGQIGLWTKADAATYFDDVKVSEVHVPGPAK